MQDKENAWEEVELSPTWDFKTDAELIGELISREDDVGPNNSVLYSFRTTDNTVVSVWGNSVLDGRLKHIIFGEKLRIVYLGKEKSNKTGRMFNNYKVYHSKSSVNEKTKSKES